MHATSWRSVQYKSGQIVSRIVYFLSRRTSITHKSPRMRIVPDIFSTAYYIYVLMCICTIQRPSLMTMILLFFERGET